MKLTFTRRLLLAATATLGLSMATATQAQQTINMIAIDGYPAKAMWVKEFSGFFIPRVNEELAKTPAGRRPLGFAADRTHRSVAEYVGQHDDRHAAAQGEHVEASAPKHAEDNPFRSF